MSRIYFSIILLLFSIGLAHADEYRPAYLEFKQTSDNEFNMLWKVPAKGQNRRLSLYVELPSDITKPSETVSAFIGGAYIERSTINRQGGLAGSKIGIRGLERVSTDVLVRIQRLDGSSETARLNARSTSFMVKGAPELWSVVNTYLVFGVEHILEGFDHLLFVACLIFIAGTWRRILITITGFTLAHSITSIVFLAREIALDKRDTLTWRHPIAVSASFGLLHGFGFASALAEIGLPQTEIPAALLAFNVGVEIGQVVFVASVILIFQLITQSLKSLKADSANWVQKIEKPMAYAIGSITMFWTLERVSGFWI
jgi:hypothetical protein